MILQTEAVSLAIFVQHDPLCLYLFSIKKIVFFVFLSELSITSQRCLLYFSSNKDSNPVMDLVIYRLYF